MQSSVLFFLMLATLGNGSLKWRCEWSRRHRNPRWLSLPGREAMSRLDSLMQYLNSDHGVLYMEHVMRLQLHLNVSTLSTLSPDFLFPHYIQMPVLILQMME
jgi:hypothetical protein